MLASSRLKTGSEGRDNVNLFQPGSEISHLICLDFNLLLDPIFTICLSDTSETDAIMKAMITIFLIISISTISNACLNLHNTYRSRHQQTPPLRKPSSRLQTYANKRAQELAGTDNFSHPTNCPYGENLFMGYGKDFNCKDAIKSWYDEIKIYNYNQASFSKQCGHFTQIVWKGTREVACARSKSRKSGNVYVVVSYTDYYLIRLSKLFDLIFHSAITAQEEMSWEDFGKMCVQR